MQLIDQVISLEYAQRLKELGVKQDSEFYYVFSRSINNHVFENDICMLVHTSQCMKSQNWVSAFNVAELFNLVPAFIDTKQNEPFNCFWFSLNKRRVLNIQYIVNYHCDTYVFGERPADLMDHNIYDENLADCLVKMLIYLLENGHVEVEE